MMKRRAVASLMFLALGVPSWAADEERRLDARLKLLQRAQRGAVELSPGRALEVVSRFGGPRRGFVREDAFLLLLVKYPGDRSRLETAGFRIQSQLGSIYTGTLAADRLSDLLKLSDLHFVQLSQEMHAPPVPRHERSRVPKKRGAPGAPAPLATQRANAPSPLAPGQGVVVGFVDTGVDICHLDFRNADAQQTTRIKYLLDFSDPGDPDGDGTLNGTGPFGGTLYNAADINSSLQTSGFCSGSTSATVNEQDTTGHGTHGLSIAAGDDPALPGLAPGADLIVVKATREAGSLSFQSVDIINALSFIDQKAATELAKPYVVNLSLGTIFASHDGRSLEEQAIDALVGPGIPGKVAVVAAGNSSQNRSTQYHHFQGTGYVGITRTHTVTVPNYTPIPGNGNDRILLDVWHEGQDKHTLKVTAPDGTTTVTAAYGDFADMPTPFGDVFIANMGGANPLNGDTEALILIDDFSGTAPAIGTWTITLVGEEIGDTGRYDGWLTDDSAVGATTPYLSSNADNFFLVGKPGGAYNAIAVGAFGRHDATSRFRTSWLDVNGINRTDSSAINGDISDFSSTGTTRDGRVKPELTAPGERNLGAVSKHAYPGASPDSIYRFHPFTDMIDALITENTVNHRFGVLQGTSFSAPVVTGLAARVLETNPGLDAIQVRNVLINSALTDGFVTTAGAVPNALWGYGKADLGVGPPPLPSDLRITVDTLPAGVVGEQYNFVLTASGGTLPYSWFVTSGSLPSGLTLENGGFLTGTPTTANSFPFTIQVTDGAGSPQVATKGFTIQVSATAALRIETTTLPVAKIDKPYQHSLEASGGNPPYTWALAGGGLPLGMSLLGNGVIQGTPTDLGNFTFTARAQDTASATAYKSFKLRVSTGAGDEWDPLGKSTPTVNQIAIDPNDPDRLFVSTTNIDAVWESTNGGDSWRPTSINNYLNAAAKQLRISPVSSSVWAISTAYQRAVRFDAQADRWISPAEEPYPALAIDFDAGERAFIPTTSGLFSWADSGASWQFVGPMCPQLDLFGGSFNRGALSIYRPTPAYMYVGDPYATCATEDEGATWVDIDNGSGSALEIRVSQTNRLDVVKAGGGQAAHSLNGGRDWVPHPLPGAVEAMERGSDDPSSVLVGTDAGLFRSVDGGQSYVPLPIKGTSAPVTALAIDPANSQRFFVGTSQGLYRSTDAGQSWELKSNGLVRRVAEWVTLSPGTPGDVLLLTQEGPYLSRKGGDAWTLSKQGLGALSPSKGVVAADPSLYFVTSGDGLFRSTNQGVSWSEPAPSFDAGTQVVAVDADPFDANVLLASLAGSRGTFRSTDRGLSWSHVDADLPLAEPTDISFARNVPGRVYASFNGKGIYRSESRGDSWAAHGLNGQTVDEVEPAPSNSAYVYSRVAGGIQFFDPAIGSWQSATTNPARPALDMAVDALVPTTAYAGVDHSGASGETGGLYRTTDGGRHWTRLVGLLDTFDVVSVATHPAESGILYVATRDGGAFRSTDGGVTWSELSNYGTVADLTNVNVQDPSNPFLLFAGTEGYGVQASTDRGKNYVPRVIGLTSFYVNALAFDPDAPTTLFAGSDGGIFRSGDSANTWNLVALGSSEISDIATDNEGSIKRIWATVVGEGVAFSGDGGNSFTVYSTGLASLELTSIAVENLGAIKRIWATMKGGDGVAYSDDLGQTWKSASGNGLTNRDVSDLAFENGAIKRIWATTAGGAFYSANAGLSWTDLSLGLPSGVPLTSATVDPNTNEVLLSAFAEDGGGVYRGGNVNGVWSPFNNGLGELKVRRLTRDGGHVVDGSTLGTTFYAATAGDGVYASEVRTPAGLAPVVATTALPDGLLHRRYDETLAATGGAPPYVWSVQGGSLPQGLVLDPGGTLSGPPGQLGIFRFTAQVADNRSRTGRRDFTLKVLDPATPTLVVGDVTISEGNAGTTNAVFPVILTTASASPVTVNYATANGTATAGSDYTTGSGNLTIPAGSTSTVITVLVSGDTVPEADETFFVNLSGASAPVADGKGRGTIRDDDTLRTLSIGDVSTLEGNTGSVALVFGVTLSGLSGQTVTVDYATGGGTAAAGSDYQASAGTLTFAPGTTLQTIAVDVIGDELDESNETLLLTLSNAVNATIPDAQGAGLIIDDDPALLFIGDVSTAEGNSGTHGVALTISLSHAVSKTVKVGYATASGSAGAADYVPISGVLSFAPGQTNKTLTVTVKSDTLSEGNETFFLNLSGPANAQVSAGQGKVTILDDDPVPSLSIADAIVTEGDSGDKVASFVTSLSTLSGRVVSVEYATGGGTATAGLDYKAASGTLNIFPGTTSGTIRVTVFGDVTPENGETFLLDLSGVVNATLANAQALGTILDDDGPALAVDNVQVAEGNAGSTNAVFTVTLLRDGSSDPVSVQYATADGTASAGSDYASASGTLSFGPSETSKTAAVAVNGDTTPEGNEAFFLQLSNPLGGWIADGLGQTMIVDDDPGGVPIAFSTVSYVTKESLPKLTVIVKRPAGVAATQAVTFQTSDGSAQAGTDYGATSGVLTFTPGLTSKTFTISILNDGTAEGSETFLVSLSNPTGGAILGSPSTAVATISDNDLAGTVQFSVVSSSVSEKVGTTKIIVSRTAGTAAGVTVNWAISGGTATAGADYTGATFGTLTFGANVASQTISIPITDDAAAEGSETVILVLSNPMGGAALGSRTTHTRTITDDETALTFSAASYAASEAVGKVTLTVKRTGAKTNAVTVTYVTSNGSATQPGDYAQTSGTLSFAPGMVSRTLSVPIVNDTDVEGAEAFQATLTGATNGAGIGPNGTATVTIADSEPGFVFSAAKYTAREISGKATITVKRTGTTSVAASVSYATSNGTATQPDDYTSTSGTLSFGPGAVTKTFLVPIVNDAQHEDPETLNLTLSSPQGAYLGTPSTAVVSITDNDAAAIVQFSGASFGASESGLVATLTLKRTGVLNVPVSVGFTTEDGTALAGQDYEAATGTVSFAAGETTKTITLNLLDDLTDEPNEALTVKLQNPTGNAVLGPLATATLWIADDE